MLKSVKSKKIILTAVLAALLTVIAAVIVIFGAGANICSAFEKGKTVFDVKAKSAYLTEYDTGAVIYSANENERLPIASMTKIMTLLLALEAVDNGKMSLNEDITVSDTAASMGGSQVFLDAGSVHKAGNLIKTIVVASANDSSVAIAERVGGSVSGFVEMMNAKAASLKMENTHFVNCTGLPAPESFSSAKDVAAMFRELIKHPAYFDYSNIWLEDYQHPGGRTTTITNTNKLVRFYKGCDGGKTGFTSEAKFCLSATAKRNGMRLIGVVIGANSSDDRFTGVRGMFDTAFGSYVNKSFIKKGESVKNSVEVKGGKKDSVKLTVDKNLTAFMNRNENASYDVKYELPGTVKAKINKGDVIGKVFLTRDGVVVNQAKIVAAESIARSSVFDEIKRIGNKWNNYAA